MLNNNTNNIKYPESNTLLDWPPDELERVHLCPVCESDKCKLLYKGLKDDVFKVAAGKWTLRSCIDCESAYLDPRPTKDFIGKAYTNYYTHAFGSSKLNYNQLNALRKIRRKLVNGYVKWKFSSNAEPSSKFGVLVSYLVPGMQRRIDREYRNLPRSNNTTRKLLDVGCGNGEYLKLASSCGWLVEGVDPDPAAIDASLRNGFKAYHGSLDQLCVEKSKYDFITLNHVIEHMHDPVASIEICYELLKPGGVLWLETPNINSNGRFKFGNHWRGLEVPRHLVIFNEYSIKCMLLKSGFESINVMAGPSAVLSMFKASYSLARGASPYNPIQLNWKQKLAVIICRIKELLNPASSEVITILATKNK